MYRARRPHRSGRSDVPRGPGFAEWAKGRPVELCFSEPRRPIKNGFIEAPTAGTEVVSWTLHEGYGVWLHDYNLEITRDSLLTT